MTTEAQCGRCGSSIERVLCGDCDGTGHTDFGELHEIDPLRYDEMDTEPCNTCRGEGGWWNCLSSEEWCKANPLSGRESWPPSKVELFEVSL